MMRVRNQEAVVEQGLSALLYVHTLGVNVPKVRLDIGVERDKIGLVARQQEPRAVEGGGKEWQRLRRECPTVKPVNEPVGFRCRRR